MDYIPFRRKGKINHGGKRGDNCRINLWGAREDRP